MIESLGQTLLNAAVYLLKICERAGEMAKWLRTSAVLPEDPGSLPSTYMVANSLLKL